VLNTAWRPYRWNPKFLFDAILRRAVLHLSQGKDMEEVRTTAASQYFQSAANPGIDVTSPYPVATEYVTLLNVLITTLPRVGIPRGLVEGSTIQLDGFFWKTSAFADPYVLHRWITVDHWDDRRERQELHSWWVAGDIVATKKPMTLHVIEIGQMRNDKRQSLWVRGWRHPKLQNVRRVKFRLSRGTFNGWNQVRLADLHRDDVEEWVEWLLADAVPQTLLHTIEVAPTEPQIRERVVKDLQSEFLRTGQLAPAMWRDLPMSRSSCDFPYACPFQAVCYDGADLEKSGLFIPRDLR